MTSDVKERVTTVEAEPLMDESLDAASSNGARPSTLARLARSFGAAPVAARIVVERIERVAVEADRAFRWRDRIPPTYATFLLFVIAPSIAAALYFAFIASDQYTVETRFAVRALNSLNPPASGLGTGSGAVTAAASMPGGVSISASTQNSYVVTSYIRSRAILDDLAPKVPLREIFRRPEADFWARLRNAASIEQLVDYWMSMVETDVDAASGVVTVKARAFRREDALTLGRAVISASEDLVNRISDRARRDATAMAEKDVRRAFVAVQAALADLNTFRDQFGMIDPGSKSTEIGALLAPLMSDKIRLENEMFVASRELANDAPTVRVLREQIESADRQIKELQSRLTSTENKSALSGSLTKFEELELQRQIAEQLYALARTELDRAQQRANRQTLYLTVFVPPAMPEASRFPHRLSSSVLILIGLGVLWTIVVMIFASIEDHRL
ncbi:capsule biosynthesis protein [Methylosinus sp. Sm6]|uniref:capsule biosynthesis protein n=1 Tax=Methylosinus sp. Sm6 TaxID=2866948 RepID=UPI001C9952E2|nr:capsule biosynthesis protein [Methylosinus sp. Sm6]MBY6239672.1 capsule biosynthesis protein [Methylosinus sp. Sm6]